MHPRRNHRIGPDEAEHLVNGDLRHLFEAARAPATEQELAGEKAMVAAFVAHRRSAERAARKRRPTSVRTAVVAMAAGLALLTFGGTAVAARTGNLPRGAQQHAHRLFSALGVPAPRTGPPDSTHPSPSPTVTALSWCDQWQGKPEPLSSENRRKLGEAAGGEDRIGKYCAEIRKSASPTPPPSAPSGSPPPPAGSGPAEPPQVLPSASPSPSTPPATATPGTSPDPDTPRTIGEPEGPLPPPTR
jgi:hypothetical protein